MSIDRLKSLVPDYAKDIRLNLGSIVADETLSGQQLWGALFASALATAEPTVIDAVAAEAEAKLSPEAFTAAKSAAAIMAMNNVYYRFLHLTPNAEYKTLPAKLRMNVLANPGVSKIDFELWSLAVSAVNGCGLCIEAHEEELRKAGVTAVQIQTAVRVAAIVHAVAAVIAGERALAGRAAVAAA